MTDNELLLALSNLFDKKLQPIKEDISELKDRVASLETKVISLENRMASLETKVISLENRMASLETKVISLEDKVGTLDTRTRRLELQLETQLIPRLQNIESCYTSTYNRYKSGVTQIEAIQEDVTILKTVVTEHSQKLQKIS